MIQWEVGYFSYKYIYLFASTFVFDQKENKQKGVYSLGPGLEGGYLSKPRVPPGDYAPGHRILRATMEEACIG